MANNREKLEKRAKKLGLSFVDDTSDEELQDLINDFQNDNPDDQEGFGDGTCFYKSSIAGLSIPVGDPEDNGGVQLHVSFQPYEVFDEKIGERYRVGYLATDEQDVQEVLADDINVEEISEEEYLEATEKHKKVVQ